MYKQRTLQSLVLLFLVLALAACSGNTNTKNGDRAPKPSPTAGEQETASNGEDAVVSTDEQVKLKLVVLGAEPVDFPIVRDEINKLTLEKINATIDVKFLDWSDWSQRYPLMFSANEDFDIVFTANWAQYSDQAIKGGFLELTEDMLKMYAPKAWESVSPSFWEQTKVNGKMYMMPHNDEQVVDKLLLVRGDLLSKYNLPAIDSLSTFEQYLTTLAQQESNLIPFNIAAGNGWFFHELDALLVEQYQEWKLVDSALPLAISIADEKPVVFNFFETTEYKDILSMYKRLAEAGAWPKNVVNNKSNVGDEFKTGKNAVILQNSGTLAGVMSELMKSDGKPEFEPTLIDLSAGKKKRAAIATQNGTAIHATSKHPERSLMLIDLLQNDKQIHDLIMYGIADKHYIPVGDDRMSAGPDADNYGGFSNWGWYSPLDRIDSSSVVEAQQMMDAMKEDVYHYDLETFVFDDSNIKNEKANVGNVLLRYGLPLEYGLVKDTDKELAALIEQLKKAGLEKIQIEMQTQIDAFLSGLQ